MDQRDDRADEDRWAGERERMVSEQLERRGIHDRRVLDAMRRVPRHLFVERDSQAGAYADCALPIGEGQTISQPFMVAVMTQALAVPPTGRVLEIGTGSGYQAAVLAQIAREVISIERRPGLAEIARQRLASLGYDNVRVVVADGSMGYLEASPYDGIIVTAGSPQIPTSLRHQLADGARLVVPVGSSFHQDVIVVERRAQKFQETRGDGCVFVPLVGEEGWPEP
jgi:protein-L-isoaspartate(D-aspartate) O-methyltransferase